MGQLTTALKATKELRKQFIKKKPDKKISKRDQNIIDAIENSDFGCQKEKVYIFAEALAERKLPRKEQENKGLFDPIKGSLLVYYYDGDFAIDMGDDTVIRWNDPISGGPCSQRRKVKLWRPATDKEIRDYFS